MSVKDAAIRDPSVTLALHHSRRLSLSSIQAPFEGRAGTATGPKVLIGFCQYRSTCSWAPHTACHGLFTAWVQRPSLWPSTMTDDYCLAFGSVASKFKKMKVFSKWAL